MFRTLTGALLGSAIAVAATFSATGSAAAAGEVNIYSLRQPFLIEPLLKAFTEKTGIKTNVVFAKDGVVERMKAEGANSPADVILTVDIGRLNDAVEAGVVQPVSSKTLDANVPASFRDPEGRWFALTQRARLIYAAKDRVKPGEITSYEQLADPKWKGRICTRSGKHDYNVALLAAMIAHHGEAKAETWLEGLKVNLARKPQGNDRGQVKAIKEGECDLALGNNYYYGAMLSNDEQKPWAEAVNPVFPTIGGTKGTHVNVSGIALSKSAPNRDNAVKLMEFLSGNDAQEIYATANYEYPVNPQVKWSPLVESWGRFTPDDLPLSAIAELRGAAVKMVDRVGYDG
ncbi:Fe(3+) ABC transporter substrate-binding protein [Thalassobaculum sp.]|uniref:Fe(3+) ABC transporter substrate-binding protein n=1 Tax=Thalassobaculum sp. TaxID=2022740 RepID=UPI0032EF2B1F